MSRLVIEVAKKQHQHLKAIAALQGGTTMYYAVERLALDGLSSTDALITELRTLLYDRIAAGLDFDDKFDMVQHPHHAIQVTLMDRIHAQKAGFPVRVGFASLPDGHLDGSCLVHAAKLALKARGVAEIVEMAVENRRQTLIAGVMEYPISALAELAGGRTRQGIMQGI